MEPQRHVGQDRHYKVVPLSTNNSILSEALSAVEAQAHTLKTADPLSCAFCYWALGEELPIHERAQMSKELCDEIAGSGRSIQAVAALGFLLGIDSALNATCGNTFTQGVDWLLGRVGYSQNSMVSLMQPLAHTGVLVGLRGIEDVQRWEKFGGWFATLFENLQSTPLRDTGCHQDLLTLVGSRSAITMSEMLKVQLATASDVVFVARGLAESDQATEMNIPSELLERIKLINYGEPEQAALDLTAFRYLMQGALQVNLRAPTLEDVGRLLRRIPAGLRRWTWDDQKKTPNSTAQKWAIEHEYHFQNFLCAVLAPAFPDLRDEEWLASVGHKKPRADLVIPSLYLLIEVKYWRKNISPQDLISQIGEDVSLYLKVGSPYRKILPVIWDQGRRTEQYDLLIAGLSEIRDVVNPVVVAQPAFME